tara:strand:+ start:4871 stop:5050 length:180 start_codon:yes stop_codon:yes gene_type:complete
MNNENYIKSTYQNNEDPTDWNGRNPYCEKCQEELDCFYDYETICNDCYNNEDELITKIN